MAHRWETEKIQETVKIRPQVLQGAPALNGYNISRTAKVQKKSVTQSISSGFFRFSYKKTSIMYIFNTTDPQERLQQLIDIREDLKF